MKMAFLKMTEVNVKTQFAMDDIIQTWIIKAQSRSCLNSPLSNLQGGGGRENSLSYGSCDIQMWPMCFNL